VIHRHRSALKCALRTHFFRFLAAFYSMERGHIMPVGTKNSTIPGCGTHHIALQTRDWEGSLRLYRELFPPKADTPTVDSPVVNDPVTHLSFATTDARAALEHVRQAGYEITGEPRDVQLGTISATTAFFGGPNGERIEFFEVR
jgi:catechol 2,3-dioxygenase-like lactoylglutathione lyase family enzyme